MFYSHDILTSPEHGVATIWLVATLGSRSITRRLNRKTILDVDVPKACNVIMDPQAPMALRLQGNLLYGVSRVYSQQCGYTLTDVQSMHDRMKTMLRILPGGALDPMAGKIRPDQLIVPYDPSFTPENDLPGLDIDLAKLTLFAEPTSTEFAWPVTPDLSQSVLSQNPSLQLSLGSGAEDVVMADVGGSEPSSVHFDLNRLATSALREEEEEGVLLQPDFEFDEDGNIIELSGQRRTFLPRFETPLAAEEAGELVLEYQEMPIDDMPPGSRENTPTPHSRPASKDASDKSPDANVAEHSATVPQRRRKQKTVVVFDEQTELRNSELAQMNSEYVQNMATASRQKKQDRRQTQAKKNAAFCVFGRGIGAVGVGVGASRVAHPLVGFSGQELVDLVSPEGKNRHNGRKRGREAEGASDTESGSEGRRVRAREEVEEQVGRGDGLQNNDVWNEEVEFGRHASSALRDDSSQMPWNITASVQSSRHGSSAANLFRGVGSSSWGMPDSAGLGHPRSRLTSASPLAGRGFPFDVEGLDSLAIPGAQGDDIDVLGDFDLNQYLQAGLYADDHGAEGATATEGGAAGWKGSAALVRKLENATLDQDSQNFLRFLVDKLLAAEDDIAEDNNDPFTGIAPIHALALSKETSFWDLLPPKDTSRAVATHGLMHILALATKGFFMVRQDAYEDLSNEDGVRYEYGEIFVRLVEV